MEARRRRGAMSHPLRHFIHSLIPSVHPTSKTKHHPRPLLLANARVRHGQRRHVSSARAFRRSGRLRRAACIRPPAQTVRRLVLPVCPARLDLTLHEKRVPRDAYQRARARLWIDHISTRWSRWFTAVENRQSVKDTWSDDERHIIAYRRYADDTTNSLVGQATRQGSDIAVELLGTR